MQGPKVMEYGLGGVHEYKTVKQAYYRGRL